MTTKSQKIIEEIILITLISMNLLEFTGLLPGEASFVKAIISLTGVGYVLYKSSFSDIFFGEQNKKIDTILMFSYFLIIFNKFIQFSKSSFNEAEVLQDFFILLLENETLITFVSLFCGTLMLLFLSFWVARHLEIKAPSIMHAIHGENIHKFFLKFSSVFILFISFFIIFFNPIIEWFSLVMDSSLVVLVLFFYIFKIHNIGKSRDSEEILFKIAESVDTYLEKFINLFHSKKTLFFAISGLIIFHLFADVAAFIIPYSLGTHSVYHESLLENHEDIYSLFQNDKEVVSGSFNHLAIFIGYIFSILGILYLMLYPAYIWYVIYISNQNNYVSDVNKRTLIKPMPKLYIGLFFAFLIFQIFTPVFSINGFSVSKTSEDEEFDLYGVDIQSQSIISNQQNIGAFLLIAFFVFSLIYAISFIPIVKHILFTIMSLIGVAFLGLYIFQYYRSIVLYYVGAISLFSSQFSFFSIYFLIFNIILLIIETVFYIGGYFSFIVHMFKE